MLGVKLNKKQLRQVDKILNKKEYKRAIKNAINSTATQVRKISVEVSTDEYHIKPARLKKDSKGRPTTFIARASNTKPFAVIQYRGGTGKKSDDRPGLHHFRIGTQKNKKKGNPRVKVRRNGSAEEIPRGFYGIGSLKGQGIFQRKEKGRKIVRRTGPGLKMMVEDKKVSMRVKAKSSKILHDQINDKMRKQIEKRG